MKGKKILKTIGLCMACLLIGAVVYLYIDRPREIELSESQMSKYTKYLISITENTTKADILNISEEGERGSASGYDYISYHSDELLDYLPECKELLEIMEFPGTLDGVYVDYVTKDDQNVSMCYGDSGVLHWALFDEKKDVLVSIAYGKGTLQKGGNEFQEWLAEQF